MRGLPCRSRSDRLHGSLDRSKSIVRGRDGVRVDETGLTWPLQSVMADRSATSLSPAAPQSAASAERYDLVVLGSGSAGMKAAKTGAKQGLRTLVIENRDFGGTCALRGCNPKKVLVRAAELADLNRRMAGRYLPDGDAPPMD